MAARYATDTFTLAYTLAAPSGASATAVGSGGTFAAGTYFWKVTFVNAAGETTGSEVTATIVLNGSCNLAWTAAAANTTTAVKVYRGTSSNGENALIATLAASAAAYTDTGTAGSAATPPASNSAITASHLVLEGSLRDSTHPAVVAVPGKFSVSAPVAGVGHVDGKLFTRLAAYPAGTELQMAMQAQDTFVAELLDGTLQTVKKGEVFADNHELVKRDLAAAKRDPARVPLFRPLDLGEEKPAPRAAKGGAA